MREDHKKLILVVDDSDDNRALLTTLCESKGISVHCAGNGAEALSLLQELSVLPDLILLDAQMPVMDGYEFRAAQKNNDRLRRIPVVVMTGESGRIGKGMLNPQGVLRKPLSLKALTESISPYL